MGKDYNKGFSGGLKMSVFQERVKYLLKIKGMTQQNLATIVGTGIPRLNSYLSGKTEAGYKTLIDIAQALNTSTDYLLGLTANSGEEGYSEEVVVRYAGTSEKIGAVYISIPVFDTKSGEYCGMFKCGAVLKNIYSKPYILSVTENSMEPYCLPGDRFLIAPRTYIPPVINSLDFSRLYAVRLAESDKTGTSLRHCLSKDHVLFLRPSNIDYETKSIDLNRINYNPVAGIAVKLIRAVH